MAKKRGREKVGSCCKITTKVKLLEWVERLPHPFSDETLDELIDRARTKSYVTWTEKGLRVW